MKTNRTNNQFQDVEPSSLPLRLDLMMSSAKHSKLKHAESLAQMLGDANGIITIPHLQVKSKLQPQK